MKKLVAKISDLTYYRRNIIWCKYRYLRATWKNGFRPNKIVLFYPDLPLSWHLAYAICHALGYAMTNDPKAKFDIAIAFEDTTFRTDNPTLSDLEHRHRVLNSGCGDISKKRVDRVFLETFGYGLEVDPRTYDGLYVKKSNLNARHPLERFLTLDKPTEPEKGYVYQKLIDNQIDKDFAMDVRTFIFGDAIPFVFYRKRSIHDRFNDDTVAATLVETDKAFSKEEQASIVRFSKAFGLDYGELDVLRDNKDGKIYIVDANNTTAGPQPGVHIKKDHYRLFIEKLAGAFRVMTSAA